MDRGRRIECQCHGQMGRGGSLKGQLMFAAILLASSFVSNFAADRRPEMPYLVQFLSSAESMDINSLASLELGSTCSNPSINLKYSGPSLSISASACLVNVSTVLGSVFG